MAAALGVHGLVLAAPNPALAQQNLSFEAGALGGLPEGWSWFGPDEAASGVQARVVASPAVDGARSLEITQTGTSTFTRLAQRVPASALGRSDGTVATGARRIRLRGAVRGEAGAPRPELWLRIAGAKGALYVDSRGDSRETGEVSVGGASGGAADWLGEELELALPADAEEVAFGALVRGPATAWFDDFRIEVIPADRLPAASPAALRYVDNALAIMQEQSINRARLEWPRLRAATLAHARGATEPAGAHLALRYAIYELGDRHSYLLGPEASAQVRRALVANVITGRALVEPRGELLGGRLGYLVLPGVGGGSAQGQVEFATGVQDLIKGLDTPNTCGWILDLRRNSGGNLWPMLAGVGPLLGNGEVGASVYPDGRRAAVWYRDGQAVSATTSSCASPRRTGSVRWDRSRC